MIQINGNEIFLTIIDRFVQSIFKIKSTSFTVPDDAIAVAHKDQISEMVDTLQRGHLRGDTLIQNQHHKVSSFE